MTHVLANSATTGDKFTVALCSRLSGDGSEHSPLIASFIGSGDSFTAAEEDVLCRALDAGWISVNDPDEFDTEDEWVADSIWVDGHGPVSDSGSDWIVVVLSGSG